MNANTSFRASFSFLAESFGFAESASFMTAAKEIFRVDGPPSFVDQWFQRVYNDVWERMAEGEQQAIIERIVMKNSRRRKKLFARVNATKAEFAKIRRRYVLS